jgi:PAS domain S-box-containing protein
VDASAKFKLKPDQYVPLAVISAMGILILVISLYYRSMAVSAESEAWVQHSHLVSSNLENMLYAMANIDASGRAFIATGDETYLESWRLGLADLKRHLEAVRALTVDNPEQQAKLPVLDMLVAERTQVDERIGASPRTQGKDGAAKVVGGGEQTQITKEFRQVVQGMQDDESGLLDRRTADAKRRLLQARIGLLLGTALGLLITGVTGFGLIRSSRRRRLAEEALRVSEDQYRTLLNEVQDHAIFMLDPMGHVVTWNAGAERINGYTAKEIIGRSFSCFFPQADIDGGKPAEMLKIAAAEGRQEEHGRRVRKNGSQYVSSTTYTALRDRDGGLRGFSEITRDLSETKESGAKYLGLLEAAPDAMVVVNQSGEIVLVNLQAEKQFGYHRDELLGQKVSNIVPQGFAERLVADGLRSAEEALAQQIGTGIELTARRKDGSEFPIEIMLSPLRSPNGILVTAAIRNISVRKAAETHLVQMEGRYRGLLEAAPDAMVVVNQQGEIVLLNLQAEKQFGYHRDELLGQKVSNIVPQGFAERLVADGLRSAEEALAQQIGTGIELTARRKDGSEFPIEIMLSPLGSAEGILVTAAIRDISVRNAADAHLVQMEGRYRGLLEAAPDAMVVVNQSGEIVLVNLQTEKQFGYRRDELLGQKVNNIVPQGFAERLVADGLRSAEEALAQQIGTGIELTARRKDGSEFPIEIMLSPLGSAEGILVTAAIRDISVRNAADAHLVQMEGRYRGLLEAAPDAMVVVNQQSEIVLLNLQAEKQFGYRRDELLGQKLTNIIPEGFAERLIADGLRSAEDALAQQIGTGLELTALRKDGSRFPMELMLSPLESDTGTLVTVAIRNITVRNAAKVELLQTVEELKRSNEDLQQFAYVASHDLQEPLRMVASYVALIARRYKGKLDADADEFISFTVDGAKRMQSLIQDLLAFSRVGSKGVELVTTSSENALNRAIKNLRGAIVDSGARVTHDPLPSVLADDMQLTQLFQNLLGNAIKYRRADTPGVHVAARQNGAKKWIFSVQDNGLGIEPQYFERIFGMFQRLHGREEFSGTGMGLAICKKIVERHGGDISVESTIGQGSTFRFSMAAAEMPVNALVANA